MNKFANWKDESLRDLSQDIESGALKLVEIFGDEDGLHLSIRLGI